MANLMLSRSRKIAINLVIYALIAVAVVSVVAVMIGSFDTIVANAVLTVVALAGFALIVWLETIGADNRPIWMTVSVVIVWAVVLLAWVIKIWIPYGSEWYEDNAPLRFVQILLIGGIARLACLHAQLTLRKYKKFRSVATASIAANVAVFLVGALALLLIVPLVSSPWVEYPQLYWRIVSAVAILAAVATVVVPLFRLISGRVAAKATEASAGVQPVNPAQSVVAPAQSPQAIAGGVMPSAHGGTGMAPGVVPHQVAPAGQAAAQEPELLPWPLFPDGTPLPQLPNGQPDFSAEFRPQN